MDISKELLSFIDAPDMGGRVPQTTTIDQPKGSGLSIDQGVFDFIASPSGVQESTPPRKQIDYLAEAKRLMPILVLTESNGFHREKDGTLRVSEKGALGITQIMPKTGKNPGYNIQPLRNQTPEEYIRVGTDYLAAMMKKFDSVERGVAAYNAGPGTLDRIVSRAEKEGRDWKEFLPKETQDYVKKVR